MVATLPVSCPGLSTCPVPATLPVDPGGRGPGRGAGRGQWAGAGSELSLKSPCAECPLLASRTPSQPRHARRGQAPAGGGVAGQPPGTAGEAGREPRCPASARGGPGSRCPIVVAPTQGNKYVFKQCLVQKKTTALFTQTLLVLTIC